MRMGRLSPPARYKLVPYCFVSVSSNSQSLFRACLTASLYWRVLKAACLLATLTGMMDLRTDHVALLTSRGAVDEWHVRREAADVGATPICHRWPRRLPAEDSVDQVAPIGPPLH